VSKKDVVQVWRHVNTTPPNTTITRRPFATAHRSTVSFSFRSNEKGSTFKCQLAEFFVKPPAFSTCTSPVTYHHLVNQLYSFTVEAINPDGEVDGTPANFQFKVRH
jgi:hypothetical protein